MIRFVGRRAACFLIAGGAAQIVGWSCFFRMTSELNKTLPPDKRIPLIQFRNEAHRIRRLYEDTFPRGRLSTAWLLFMVIGTASIAAAVVAEAARTSK
jgi:hypothetical protein